jgi:hypothetical protein
MRKLILFILLVTSIHRSFAQTNINAKYEVKWKAVDAAFKKGLNKTAQTEIESILKLAKSESNTEQTIIALCNYRVSLRDRSEKSRLTDILFFEKELSTAKFPTKQILYSMLGDLYWTYYQENRWKILDRTSLKLDDKRQSVENINKTDNQQLTTNNYLCTLKFQKMNLREKQQHEFLGRHIGITATETTTMLQTIGMQSVEELIDKTIPASIRLPKDLEVSAPMSEFDYLQHINDLGKKNKLMKNYIGMGYYGTIVPSVILRNVFENPGFFSVIGLAIFGIGMGFVTIPVMPEILDSIEEDPSFVNYDE